MKHLNIFYQTHRTDNHYFILCVVIVGCVNIKETICFQSHVEIPGQVASGLESVADIYGQAKTISVHFGAEGKCSRYGIDKRSVQRLYPSAPTSRVKSTPFFVSDVA